MKVKVIRWKDRSEDPLFHSKIYLQPEIDDPKFTKEDLTICLKKPTVEMIKNICKTDHVVTDNLMGLSLSSYDETKSKKESDLSAICNPENDQEYFGRIINIMSNDRDIVVKLTNYAVGQAMALACKLMNQPMEIGWHSYEIPICNIEKFKEK